MFLTRPNRVPIDRPVGLFGQAPGFVPITTVPDLWWFDAPIIWDHPETGRVVIPTGLISDDASVPKIVDWIPFLDRQGFSRLPGGLHDGAYALGREKGKAWADNLLRLACLAEGMTGWQARTYWLGVHLFGGSSYADDARNGRYDGRIVSGNFISAASYQAWKDAGGSIFPAAA